MNQTEKIENVKDQDSTMSDLQVSEERAEQTQGGACRPGAKMDFNWKVEEGE